MDSESIKNLFKYHNIKESYKLISIFVIILYKDYIFPLKYIYMLYIYLYVCFNNDMDVYIYIFLTIFLIFSNINRKYFLNKKRRNVLMKRTRIYKEIITEQYHENNYIK